PLSITLNDTPSTARYTLSLHDALPISVEQQDEGATADQPALAQLGPRQAAQQAVLLVDPGDAFGIGGGAVGRLPFADGHQPWLRDRKSTRLNSSHVKISYAVFCLKKKK